MATTMFFEGFLKNAANENSEGIPLEFGRSSYLNGESLIYINFDGKFLILNEKTGREIYDAISDLGAYLGYDREK